MRPDPGALGSAVDLAEPAHLVISEYATRGLPWPGLCGRRFNAAGYTPHDHGTLCRACLAAYREGCRAGRQFEGTNAAPQATVP